MIVGNEMVTFVGSALLEQMLAKKISAIVL